MNIIQGDPTPLVLGSSAALLFKKSDYMADVKALSGGTFFEPAHDGANLYKFCMNQIIEAAGRQQVILVCLNNDSHHTQPGQRTLTRNLSHPALKKALSCTQTIVSSFKEVCREVIVVLPIPRHPATFKFPEYDRLLHLSKYFADNLKDCKFVSTLQFMDVRKVKFSPDGIHMNPQSQKHIANKLIRDNNKFAFTSFYKAINPLCISDFKPLKTPQKYPTCLACDGCGVAPTKDREKTTTHLRLLAEMVVFYEQGEMQSCDTLLKQLCKSFLAMDHLHQTMFKSLEHRQLDNEVRAARTISVIVNNLETK